MMLRTREVAQKINVRPETIKRWIKQGKVPCPKRDRNGWYVFDEHDLKSVIEYATKIHTPENNPSEPTSSDPAT